jgi:D-alanyl-D-alanine dipeptidase
MASPGRAHAHAFTPRELATPGVRFLLLLALPFLVLSAEMARADAPAAAESSQIILVETRDWQSRAATLTLYGRVPGKGWRQDGAPIPVFLGKNGLGWGRGLHGDPWSAAGGAKDGLFASGPVKREGDKKAPAGIYKLGFLFGYAPAGRLGGKFPYRQMTDANECVDDADSPLYNQVIDAAEHPARGWKSFERMRRDDDVYSLGLTVEHNPAPAVPGAGSCIFLHVREKQPYTSGCTSMDRRALERVAAWLDASKNPLLVQIPKGERARFRAIFGTP